MQKLKGLKATRILITLFLTTATLHASNQYSEYLAKRLQVTLDARSKELSDNIIYRDRPIHEHAEKDDLVGVKNCLKDLSQTNKLNQQGMTPLMIAAMRRNLELVTLLVSQPNINLDLQDKEGNTALMHAVLQNTLNLYNIYVTPPLSETTIPQDLCTIVKRNNNYIPIAKLLLKHKANPNIPNNIHKYPLQETIFISDKAPSLMKAFFSHGANPNVRLINRQIPLLHSLIHTNQYDLIKQYLQCGGNANVENISTDPIQVKNAITCAIYKRNYDILRLFVTHKATDINKKTEYLGDTVLHFAIQQKDITAIKILLKHPEIDIYQANWSGQTPWDKAINSKKEVYRALYNHDLTSKLQKVEKIVPHMHRQTNSSKSWAMSLNSMITLCLVGIFIPGL